MPTKTIKSYIFLLITWGLLAFSANAQTTTRIFYYLDVDHQTNCSYNRLNYAVAMARVNLLTSDGGDVELMRSIGPVDRQTGKAQFTEWGTVSYNYSSSRTFSLKMTASQEYECNRYSNKTGTWYIDIVVDGGETTENMASTSGSTWKSITFFESDTEFTFNYFIVNYSPQDYTPFCIGDYEQDGLAELEAREIGAKGTVSWYYRPDGSSTETLISSSAGSTLKLGGTGSEFTPPTGGRYDIIAKGQSGALIKELGSVYVEPNDHIEDFDYTFGTPTNSTDVPFKFTRVKEDGSWRNLTSSDASGGDLLYDFKNGPIPEQGVLPSNLTVSVRSGTYQVMLQDQGTDKCGTAINNTKTITIPAPVTMTTAKTNVSCYGGSDGTITVSAAGGSSNYSYSKNGGSTWQNSNVFTGLSTGTYAVKVKDKTYTSWTASRSVTVGQASDISASLSSTDACYGESNGVLTINSSGGTGSHTYSLDGGSFVSSNQFNVAAGSHNVRVRDANGCIKTFSHTVTQNSSVLAASYTVTDYNGSQITCAGANDAAVDVTVSGGRAPYAYSWKKSGSAYATTQDISSLSPGTYTLTVTDATGCNDMLSVTIAEPAALTLSATLSNYSGYNISCEGENDGFILLTANGGSGSKSYSWVGDSGSTYTTRNLSNLPPDRYTVTVTDANGCTASATYDLTSEPTELLVSSLAVTTDYNGYAVSCFGANDGAVNLEVSGGTGVYTYSWTKQGTPAFSSAVQDPASLTAGTYYVTVSDENSCNVTETIILNEPVQITNNTLISDYNGYQVSCNNPSEGDTQDGDIKLTVYGGVAPYAVSWFIDDVFQSSAVANEGEQLQYGSLAVGTYKFIISDQNATCPVTVVEELIAPEDPIVLNAVKSNYNGSDVKCYGSEEGYITLNPTGGAGGYSYSWTYPGGEMSSDQNISSLGSGNYQIVVTDVNGCSVAETITLTDPAPLAVTTLASKNNYNGFEIDCYGSATGDIELNMIGGTGAYTYAWTKQGEAYTSSLEDPADLTAGTYYVTVTDVNGCQLSDTITLNEPSPIEIAEPVITPPTCIDRSDALIDLSITGGVQHQQVAGDPGDGYRVELYQGIPPDFVDHSPEMTHYFVNGNFDGDRDGIALEGNYSGLEYLIRVIDKNGCETTDTVTIVDDPEMVLTTLDSIPPKCFGGADGSFQITAANGTSFGSSYYEFYLYEGIADIGVQNPVDTLTGVTVRFTGLTAGYYTVWAKDADGCNTAGTIQQIEVPEQLPLVLTIDEANSASPSCYRGGDGYVTLRVTGGGVRGYSFGVEGNYADSVEMVTLADSAVVFYNLSDTVDYTFYATNGSYVEGDVNLSLCYVELPGVQLEQTPYAHAVISTTHPTCEQMTGELSVNLFERDDTQTNTLTDTAAYTFIWYKDAALTEGYDTLAGITPSLSGVPSGEYWLWAKKHVSASEVSGSLTNYQRIATNCGRLIGSATVNPLPELSNLSVTPMASSCAGDGSITVTVDSNKPSQLRYAIGSPTDWQVLPQFTGLPAGAYTVYASLGGETACMSSATVNVPSTSLPIAMDNLNLTHIGCQGEAVGQIGMVGLSAYSQFYLQSEATSLVDSTASSRFGNLPAGDYLFWAKDSRGCLSDTLPFTINEPEEPLTVAVTSNTPTACAGCETGVAVAQASGGSGNYTYLWFDLAGNPVDPEALGAGDYQVESVDNTYGCTATTTFRMEALSSGVTASYTVISEPTCGLANGVVQIEPVKNDTIHAKYQAADYAYYAGTKYLNATGLIGGISREDTLTIRVKDLVTLAETTIAVAFAPLAPLVIDTLSTTRADIGTANGELNAYVTGGSYSYILSPSGDLHEIEQWYSASGDTLYVSADSLNAGIELWLNIEDEVYGCRDSASFMLNNFGAPVITLDTLQEPYCGQPVGEVSVSVDYAGSYDIEWFGMDEPHTNATTVSGLSAGDYLVKVVLPGGAVSSLPFTLSDDLTMEMQASDFRIVTTPSACGKGLGTAEVERIGGPVSLEDYSFIWNNAQGVFAYSQKVTALTAGDYTLTLISAEGCRVELPFEITDRPDPLITKQAQTASACGKALGTATVSASGGVGDFMYFWSTVAGDTLAEHGPAASALLAGNYWVFAQDQATGCTTDTLSITIGDAPDLMLHYENKTDVSCSESADGRIEIGVTNGQAPYAYSWDDEAFVEGQNERYDLTKGAHTVSVRDANGCLAIIDFTIGGPEPLWATAAGINPKCSEGRDGELSVSVVGGTAPYEVQWFDSYNSSVDTGSIVSGLTAGSYYSEVRDANGCMVQSAVVTLTNPDSLQIILEDVNPPHCIGGTDGSALVSVIGGTGSYSYLINGSPSTTNSFESLPAGEHIVTVTDTENCSKEFTFNVPQADPLAIDSVRYSQPNCQGASDGSLEIFISGGNGGELIEWSAGLTDGPADTKATGLSAGSYSVFITDKEGCQLDTTFILSEPDALLVSDTRTYEPNCNGESGGIIALTIEGGAPPYQIRWSNNAVGDSIAGLSAGDYTATITDQNRCSVQHYVFLTEPDAIQISAIERVEPTCSGASDGSITISVAGGRGTLNIVWPDGQRGASASGLPAGSYQVQVSDERDCMLRQTIILGEPSPLSWSGEPVIVMPTCFGQADGSLEVAVEGGTTPYRYQWSDGQQQAMATGLTAGTYRVTVFDAQNCSITQDIVLNQSAALTTTHTSIQAPTCHLGSDGSATVEPAGGTPPYTIEWEDGQTVFQATGLTAGVQRYIMTDSIGCVFNGSVTIPQTDALEIEGIPSYNLVCEGQVLTFGPLGEWEAYAWTKDQEVFSTEPEIELTEPGVYTLTVTSAEGCPVSMDFEIETSTDLLSADYLVATSTFVGDTVVLVDLTLPVPDSIQWVFDRENAYMREVEENELALKLLFRQEGTYTVGMYAYQGECIDYYENEVVVMAQPGEDRVSDILSRVGKEGFMNLSVYPNPSMGQFEVEVLMKESSDVSIEIMDLMNNRLIRKYTRSGKDNYRVNVRLDQVFKGLYLVRVVSDKQVKVEKLLIN